MGVDEAHYALYGKYLALSYVDHPPLVGWVQFLSFKFTELLNLNTSPTDNLILFGLDSQTIKDLIFRLPAIFCGAFVHFWMQKIWKLIGVQLKERMWLGLALETLWIPFVLWIFFLPDTIMAVFVFLLIGLLTNSFIYKNQKINIWKWLCLGLLFGFLGLAKYTSVIFVFGFGILFLYQKLWKISDLKNIVLAVFVAVVCICPVLIWNYNQDWLSFKYQTSHVLDGGYSLSNLLGFFVSQCLAYNPVLFIGGINGCYQILKKNPTQIQTNNFLEIKLKNYFYLRNLLMVSFLILGPVILFFTYSSLKQFVLLHWTMTVWIVLLPLGWVWFIHKRPVLFKCGTLLFAGLLLVLMLEVRFKIIPFSDFKSPYTDISGYPELKKQLPNYINSLRSTYANLDKPFFLAVPNWTLGSRLKYYLEDMAPVFVMDHRTDQFDIWESNMANSGVNIEKFQWGFFVVANDYSFNKEQAEQEFQCQKIEDIGTVKKQIQPLWGAEYLAQEFKLILCVRSQNFNKDFDY